MLLLIFLEVLLVLLLFLREQVVEPLQVVLLLSEQLLGRLELLREAVVLLLLDRPVRVHLRDLLLRLVAELHVALPLLQQLVHDVQRLLLRLRAALQVPELLKAEVVQRLVAVAQHLRQVVLRQAELRVLRRVVVLREVVVLLVLLLRRRRLPLRREQNLRGEAGRRGAIIISESEITTILKVGVAIDSDVLK